MKNGELLAEAMPDSLNLSKELLIDGPIDKSYRKRSSDSEETLCAITQNEPEKKPETTERELQRQQEQHVERIKHSAALLAPYSLTLTTSTLFSLVAVLTIALFILPQIVLALLLILTPTCVLVHHDYHKFLALGPGGTPQTFRAYLGLLRVRPFVLQDLFSPPPREDNGKPLAGMLSDDALPYRPGPPPQIAGLVPERQVEQAAPAPQRARLRHALQDLATRHPDELGFAASTVDRGHGIALFVRRPMPGTEWSRGEVCHVHDYDGSLHLSLRMDDVGPVLRKGWARRHPLSGVAPGWEWAAPGLPALPANFVLIYAPRDEVDLEILCQIIEAAIWYVSGKKFKLKLPAVV